MYSSATRIGLTAILLWSGLALLTAASGTMPAFQLAAITFAIGGALGIGYAIWQGRLSALRQPWPVWLLGAGGLFGYHALYFSALRQAPPAEAGLIAYLWPLLIVLLSAALPGERLGIRHVAGATLGLAGVVTLIAGPKFVSGTGPAVEAGHLKGFGLALACAFVWSIYSVLSRRFKSVPSEAVAGFCIVTALLAALCHILFETTVWPVQASNWLAILGLGLGPVGLAFYTWDHGVKHGDIRFLGVASYAAPMLSTLVLVAAGLTVPSWTLALACALIVAAAIVAKPKAG